MLLRQLAIPSNVLIFTYVYYHIPVTTSTFTRPTTKTGKKNQSLVDLYKMDTLKLNLSCLLKGLFNNGFIYELLITSHLVCIIILALQKDVHFSLQEVIVKTKSKLIILFM